MNPIQSEQFEQALAQEGFQEVVTVTWEAGSRDTHSHPFEAKALITSGEITIGSGGVERIYKVGDVFQLGANIAHTETYGPKGVTYLVGRKTT